MVRVYLLAASSPWYSTIFWSTTSNVSIVFSLGLSFSADLLSRALNLISRMKKRDFYCKAGKRRKLQQIKLNISIIMVLQDFLEKSASIILTFSTEVFLISTVGFCRCALLFCSGNQSNELKKILNILFICVHFRSTLSVHQKGQWWRKRQLFQFADNPL